MSKVVFLHIGTHKTGTTSLQTFLARNELNLASYGAYFPKAGRITEFSGHHNLAWELNDDERFDPQNGGIRDLRDELSSTDWSTVILSSEDFEYLYCRPERLKVLKSLADLLEYELIAVGFFRDPASYANSLYAELAKHRLTQSIESFVDDIVTDGEFVFNSNWRFCFDYPRIVEGFQSIFGKDRFIWHPYRRRIEESFFRVVGLDDLYGRLEGEYRENESIGAETVEALLAFNHGEKSQHMTLNQIYEHRDEILAQMAEKDSGVRFNGITGPFKDRLERRFRDVLQWLNDRE